MSAALPAKTKAPISKTNPERIKLTLQGYRLENKMMKSEIEKLQVELKTKSISVNNDLSEDFTQIISATDPGDIPPYI